ncbi:MAG: DNA polymerase III subunit beta [Candidatus Methylomirabilales bacterium]
MEIQVERDTFLTALGQVQGVVEAKKTLAILSHLLLETRDGQILVFGTDLDVGIQSTLSGEVLQPGAITLPAKRLYDITRELPPAPIHLKQVEDHVVQITCERSTFHVKGLAKEEFPTLPVATKGPRVTLSRRGLKEMIHRTLFAVSTDQTRPTLNGAMLQIGPDDARMVATDGHRLALATAPRAEVQGEGISEALIPRKALLELGKLLKDEEGEAQVHAVDNQLIFILDRNILTARLLEGQFPNYQQVLPTTSSAGAMIRKEDLLGALRRTSTIVGDRATPTILELKTGRLVVSCSNADLGDAREEILIEYRGADLRVGFNARYIMDFLGVVNEAEVTLHLNDPLSPALFRPKQGEGYRCVIMPMRI